MYELLFSVLVYLHKTLQSENFYHFISNQKRIYFAMENLEENLNSLWQKSKENLQMKIVQLLLCRTYELAIYPQ